MARKVYKRKPGWKSAQESHNEWLRSMGVNPDKKPTKRSLKGVKRADLSVESSNSVKTSDKIPASGSIKETSRYTGDQLVGVALMHKQAYEPIRKDNKQAAVASAQMRRN